jgi:hypothetical protein
MEYPTFFTAEGYAEVTPGTVSQRMIDFVTIHEFGHGYFMGILGSNEFEEPMLDEGMNAYWDDRMMNTRHEDIHLTTPFLRWLGIDPAFNPYVLRRLLGVVDIGFPADSLDGNSWDRISNASYGSVYMRTAATMHTLENLLGPKLMGRAMKAYYERWKFRHPSAADLRAVLEEVSGKPAQVDKVFAEQVYGTRRVNDKVVDIDTIEQTPRAGSYIEGGKRVARTQDEADKTVAAARKAWDKQHPHSKDGPYPWLSIVTVRRDGAAMPETLKVTFADGSTTTAAWTDGSRWKRFSWDRPVKVVSAGLDPENRNFLDVDMLDNGRAVKANPAASRRWTADFAALAKSLFTFMVTL